MLSESEQDYIKTIYKLQNRQDSKTAVNTNLLAETLSVTAASVTNMVKNLAKLKLLSYEPYKGVTLTDEGEKIALEIVRHHRLIELYLAKALNVPWDQVHAEAEKWEHFLSEDIEDRMAEFLDNPTHDPHGSPIPSKAGIIEEHDSIPLSQMEEGQSGTVVEVDDHDPALLRYLDELGLTPQQKINLVAREPFNGPIWVQVGKEKKMLGHEAANHVHVTI
jgi:DtxR family Mn-dependent transcriptional regulator